jgi:xanthine/uracil permease
MLIFLLSAAVQVNDPDPTPWILIYLMSAGIAAAAFLRHANQIVIAFGLLACLAAAVPLLASLAAAEASSFTNAGMANLRDEQAREALGLLIAAGWMVSLLAFISPGEGRSRR